MSRRMRVLTGLWVTLAALIVHAEDDAAVVVRDWQEKAHLTPQSLHGMARRTRYDRVSRTVTPARAEFWTDGPRWRLDLAPTGRTAKLPKAPDGELYSLKEATYERWVRTDEELIHLSGDAVDVLEVRRVPLPFMDESWFARAIHKHLVTSPGDASCVMYPLWRSHSGGELLRHPDLRSATDPWSWSLGGLHAGGSHGRVHLVAHPRFDHDRATGPSSIEFLLDRKNYQPIAVKVVDPGGGSYDSYVFIPTKTAPRQMQPFDQSSWSDWPPRMD